MQLSLYKLGMESGASSRIPNNMAAKALHLFLVAWGALEILLFGGLIFGWASLVYILKQEGYFGELCVADLSRENVSATIGLTGGAGTTGGEGLAAGYDISGVTPTSSADVFDILVKAHHSFYNGSNSSLPTYLTGVPAKGISSCAAQDRQFNLVYTLSTVINGVTLFVNGYLMDKYGTRLCRCIGIATYIAATLMAAFSTPGTAVLLYPSMILLSLGGYYFIMTNFQLGNILPSKRSTIISLYCGAYDSSAFLLLLFKFAYEGGVTLQSSFLVLTVAFSMCIVSTFWFMPRMRIPHPIPDGYRVPLTCSCKQKNTSPPPESEEDVELNGKSPTSSKDLSVASATRDKQLLFTPPGAKPLTPPTFYSLVASPLFLWDLVWLTCHRFASWSFVGRLNPALNQLAQHDTAVVSQYTSVYAALQFFGIFLAPLSGRLMDRRRKLDPDTPQNPRLDKLEVCVASFVLNSTIGTLLAITLSIPIIEVQYVSFVLHVIHRACLYGPNSAFIAQAFPMEHFGKLFGLAMSFAAAFSLLQFPIFVMIQGPLNGNPLLANLFTLVLMLISYCHPIYITLWCRRQRRKDIRNRDAIFKPKTPLTLEVTNLLNSNEGTPLQAHTE